MPPYPPFLQNSCSFRNELSTKSHLSGAGAIWRRSCFQTPTMKIESTGISPAGNRVLTLRLGAYELTIIKGLIRSARTHTPSTPDTRKTLQRLQSMAKAFLNPEVDEWLKQGDSSDREDSNAIP